MFGCGGEYLYAGTSSGDLVSIFVKNKISHCTVPICSGGIHSFAECGGTSLAIGGGDGSVTIMAAEGRSFTMLNKYQVEGAVTAMGLVADKPFMVVGTHRAFLYTLDLQQQQPPQLLAENHVGSIAAVAYPPDISDCFATAASDGTIRVWDVSHYTVVAKGVCKEATPTSLAFTGDCLFAGFDDGKIRSFDAETGEFLWAIDNAHRNGVTALRISHNQKFLVSGGEQGEVRLWEIRTRELISHLKEHALRVTDVQLFANDLYALSSSRDRSFLCWDLRREKRVSNHTQRMGGMNCTALANDQTQVVSVGQEKKITLWDIREHQPLQVLPCDESEQMTVALSHDNRYFATGGSDQLVKLYDMQRLVLLAKGEGHSATITSVAFSPDDKQLVSVGRDGNIFIWNIYPEE